jgi:hypothetical protein
LPSQSSAWQGRQPLNDIQHLGSGLLPNNIHTCRPGIDKAPEPPVETFCLYAIPPSTRLLTPVLDVGQYFASKRLVTESRRLLFSMEKITPSEVERLRSGRTDVQRDRRTGAVLKAEKTTSLRSQRGLVETSSSSSPTLHSYLFFSEERDVCAPPVPGSPAQQLPTGRQTAGTGNTGPDDDGPPAHFSHRGKPGKARGYFCPGLSHGAYGAVLIPELSANNVVRSSSCDEEEGRNTAGRPASSDRGEFRRVVNAGAYGGWRQPAQRPSVIAGDASCSPFISRELSYDGNRWPNWVPCASQYPGGVATPPQQRRAPSTIGADATATRVNTDARGFSSGIVYHW